MEGVAVRKLDEYYDALYWSRIHKTDLEEALDRAGFLMTDREVNEILRALPGADWDDDYDGIESYWLEGKVEL